jgi:hypothetical protein
VQCRGIGRQLQQLSSGSTPHDRVTIPQICLARSPALDRPRQSTLRYPTGVSNRPTGHHARRDPLPIHQPLHRPPTRCGGSIPITNISRGSQISITPVARPSVPLRAVSSLGGFRTPAAELAAPSLMRPASETLHNRYRNRLPVRRPLSPRKPLARSMCPLGPGGLVWPRPSNAWVRLARLGQSTQPLTSWRCGRGVSC